MNKNLSDLFFLVRRNIKMYFKDKSVFLISLITPAILLVLFVTFLKSVYTNLLINFIPQGAEVSSRLTDGFVAGWLVSSILATSCVTIAFCSNTIIISDKSSGAVNDILVAPVKRTVLSFSYLVSNLIVTLMVSLACLGLGFVYMAIVGWYLSLEDVTMILLNALLLTVFGSSFATLIEHFISSMGVGTALTTLVSSMYGFVCGAYMPISQFAEGIQNVLKFLPGTYGTIVFRYYFTRGAVEQLGAVLPTEAMPELKSNFDTEIDFFGSRVSNGTCFAIVGAASLLLLTAFFLVVLVNEKKEKSLRSKTK